MDLSNDMAWRQMIGVGVGRVVLVRGELVDAPRSSVGKVSCPSGQRTQVRTPVAEWSGKSNCGRMVREVKLPGELDTTDTHTDARSAKKDVISTKPQKAMGAERTFAREHKRKSTNRTSLRSDSR